MSKITNAFINKKIITVNNDNDSKHEKLFAIKNFFYRIITLGFTRSLYEEREKDKKELFNVAFSVFKATPFSVLQMQEDYRKDMYIDPNGKYKIYQYGYNIYQSVR